MVARNVSETGAANLALLRIAMTEQVWHNLAAATPTREYWIGD